MEGKPKNCIVVAKNAAAPEGTTLLAQDDSAALYVVSRAVMEGHRGPKFPDRPGSWVYQAPRWTMLKKDKPLSETWAEIRRRLGLYCKSSSWQPPNRGPIPKGCLS